MCSHHEGDVRRVSKTSAISTRTAVSAVRQQPLPRMGSIGSGCMLATQLSELMGTALPFGSAGPRGRAPVPAVLSSRFSCFCPEQSAVWIVERQTSTTTAGVRGPCAGWEPIASPRQRRCRRDRRLLRCRRRWLRRSTCRGVTDDLGICRRFGPAPFGRPPGSVYTTRPAARKRRRHDAQQGAEQHENQRGLHRRLCASATTSPNRSVTNFRQRAVGTISRVAADPGFPTPG